MKGIYRSGISLGYLLFFLWIVGLSSWYSTLVTYYNHLGELLNLLYAQANPTDSLLQNLWLEPHRHQYFLKFPTWGQRATQGVVGHCWRRWGWQWVATGSHCGSTVCVTWQDCQETGGALRGRWLYTSHGDCLLGSVVTSSNATCLVSGLMTVGGRRPELCASFSSSVKWT